MEEQLKVQEELSKAKCCVYYDQIQEIYRKIEQNMNYNIISQIYQLFEEYELDVENSYHIMFNEDQIRVLSAANLLDNETQFTLAHMILRFFEKEPLEKSVESTLVAFLKSFFPQPSQKRTVNEGVTQILENIIHGQMKRNPRVFAKDFEDHKTVFQLLDMASRKENAIVLFKVILRLVEDNNFAFYVFFEGKKYIETFLIDEITRILLQIKPNASISDPRLLKKLKYLQSILFVLTEKVSRQKNSYIFTTQVLDNEKLVGMWRQLLQLEYNQSKTLLNKFTKEEEQKPFINFLEHTFRYATMLIEVMRDRIKLPRHEITKCRILEENLVELISLVSSNIDTYLQYYFEVLTKLRHMKNLLMEFLHFLKLVISTCMEENGEGKVQANLKQLFHSLSSHFLTHSIFFLMSHTELETNVKDDIVPHQYFIWDLYTALVEDGKQPNKKYLQIEALQMVRFFCQKVPDCVNLLTQYAKELLIFCTQEGGKIDTYDHPFLSHFSQTVLLSRCPLYARIYACLSLIYVLQPLLSERAPDMAEQKEVLKETIFFVSEKLADFPMALIKLMFLIIARQMKEELFVESNKNRLRPLIRLIFSQSLLKECQDGVQHLVQQLLKYFEDNTLPFMMQPIIDNVTQVVETTKDPNNIKQIIKLNATWTELSLNVEDIKNEEEKERIRSTVLNYLPLINACVNRFNLVNEQLQKMVAQHRQQLLQQKSSKPGQQNQLQETSCKFYRTEMGWSDFQKQIGHIDLVLLKLLKSCCKNLQPKKDLQQFIDIEKKLTPMFRLMLEENNKPYIVKILKVAEGMVLSKQQMTPTTSYALKNLETYFNQQQTLKQKLQNLENQLRQQQQENYVPKQNQPSAFQIQQQLNMVQKQLDVQGTGMIIRAKTFQRFVAYGQEFFRVNSNYLVSILDIVCLCLQDAEYRCKNNDQATNQLFQIIQILFLNHQNPDLTSQIPKVINALLLDRALEREGRLHRILSVLAICFYYGQIVYEYFLSNQAQFAKLYEFLITEISPDMNQKLKTEETKIFVCGISALLLRYRNQLQLTVGQTSEIVGRVINILFWQKYEHDKTIYFDISHKKESDDEALSEFFLSEYHKIPSVDYQVQLFEQRPLFYLKYYKDNAISLKEIDEYLYFKKFLINSFQSDKVKLQKFVEEFGSNIHTLKAHNYARRYEMMAQLVLRCKRVRVEAGIKQKKPKEYIRIIFSFKAPQQVDKQ